MKIKDFIEWRKDIARKKDMAVNNQAVFINDRFNPASIKEIMTFVAKKDVIVECYLTDGTHLRISQSNPNSSKSISDIWR